MGTILRFYGPRDVRFDDYEEPALGPKDVRLLTLYSGVSAGTEMSHYLGTNPFRHKKYQPETKLFQTQEDPHYYPRGTGYEEVGRVTEIGADVTAVKPGDVVYGTWQHKSTHVLSEEVALRHKLPAKLDPVCGIFSHIGAIALNGILDAQINVGETVYISGQGTPGLIATQLARLSGARVIVADMLPSRREIGLKMGADIALDPASTDVGQAMKRETDNRGADVCIELSGSTQALAQCIRACTYSGRVVALGFYQKEAAGIYLGEEFHHNRIEIVSSQIGGMHPRYAYRWNNNRMYDTIMHLQAGGKLRLTELISHRVPFRQAETLYQTMEKAPADVLQGVLTF